MEQMTNLTDTVKYIATLGERTANAENKAKKDPCLVELYGRQYLYQNDTLREVPQPEPLPEYYHEMFRSVTLDGLIDWIKADTDKLFTLEAPPALVVVNGPKEVRVYSHAQGARKKRIAYAACDYNAPQIPFNEYRDSEELFVNIQTCFIPDANRDIVLRVVNNMTEEQSAQVSDDGISQRVTVKAGVQEVDKTIFKNPAPLRPMRTFTEVEQPMSPFVVRFKEGKRAALFEADGGKWKVEAVRAIGEYLKEKLDGCNVVVIA